MKRICPFPKRLRDYALGNQHQAHAASPSIYGLHVSGNHILNGNNQVVRLLGADRAGSEYMCKGGGNQVFDGPSDAASVQAMTTWDMTAIRVPLNEDCWLGLNGYPAGYSASTYQQAIINYVNLLNSYNLMVILDLHWSSPGVGQPSSGQQDMPDLATAPQFWTSVANTFKNNSSVIFDLYNEPNSVSWSCWLNGSTAPSTAPCSNVGFAVAGMQTLVNTVRNTGATNVLMAGGNTWSNDLTGWLANEPQDPLHDLAASFHLYNFNACSNVSCWNSQVAPVAAQVPVVTGELGDTSNALWDNNDDTFLNSAMNWFDQEGISYLSWTWNTSNNWPWLINSWDGTQPTPEGVAIRNHLISLGGPPPTPTSTPAPLPSPWQTQDIGAVGLAGSASYNNGTFTVTGSGSDIWNGSDQFRYVFQPLNGDGQIVAHVGSQTNSDPWAKAGVMIRETLDPGATFADMVLSPGNGANFQSRSSTGGSCASTGGPAVTAPYWVQLTRTGNTLSGAVSADGTTWTPVGSVSISMASSVYIGLAVTAHNNTTTSTATFDQVTVSTGGGTPTPTPTPTNTPTPTPTPTGGLAIDAGGPGSGSFVADTDFSGGTATTHSVTVSTTGVSNPAPEEVYQSERYGNFTYTISGLTPNASYTVRLHEAETYWTTTGQREFNVSINGSQVLTNFDIVAAAGGADKAIVEQFSATANGSGTITIQFTTVVNNAKVDGIEIIPA